MNDVNLTISENTTVVDLMTDVDLTIRAHKEGEVADLCDVIRDVILARCDGKANLPPGAYNIRMLCVVTRNEDEHVEKTSELLGDLADHNLPKPHTTD